MPQSNTMIKSGSSTMFVLSENASTTVGAVLLPSVRTMLVVIMSAKVTGRPQKQMLCLHPDEQLAHDGGAEQREHDGGQNADDETGGRALPHAAHVLRAKALPRVDGKTGGRAHDKPHDEKEQRPRAADGRQRLHAEDAPDDERVDEAVELLENITRDERQGKP